MKKELVSPSMLFLISAVVTSISYCIYIMTCWEQRTKNGKELFKVPMQRNFTQRFLDCIAKII